MPRTKIAMKLGTRVEIKEGTWKGLRGTVISDTLVVQDVSGKPVAVHIGKGMNSKGVVMTARIKYPKMQPVNWLQDIAVHWDNGDYEVLPKQYVKVVR
jgi:hypothetical protein